jgi:hypothetical protein
MPDPEKGDSEKKPSDDWFVGDDESFQSKQAKPPQPPPPKPQPDPPAKGRLLPALVLLALLVPGGYYIYSTRSHKAPVEGPAIPKIAPAGEAAPPASPKVEPAPPTLPVHKPEQKAAAAPPKPKPEQPPLAPASGIMLWSGKVDKNGTIVIDGRKSETGSVNGAVLPGVPVTVRVEPKGFTVAEPPSAATGWKRIAIHSAKKAHIVVSVFWKTKPR